MDKKSFILITFIVIFATFSYLFIDKNLALFLKDNSLKDFFSKVTVFGKSEYYLIPSFLVFLIAKKFNEKLSKKALYIFTTVALSGILVILIKTITARYRPPALLKDNLYGFNWFDVGYIVNSFPSGHATTAFSAFVGFSLLWPRYAAVFITFALLIALSRVILDVHYLSDILIGSLLGSICSIYLYKKFFERER